MNKTIKNPNEIDLGIVIHLTPTLAKGTKIHGIGCNHSTQFTLQINALWTVTQLLLGETNEN
ncbi:hypothetical protein [Acinetobacter sp. DSM 11652]|uniref:hypothetical protein n=1 Tax=Acinetobacter sp. DSM 11652 TaxID=346222 RepID=UPI0008B41055|nr:hypothetical protein [Acinetobacter sp. DSM 11652]SEL34763.1 hypothetical protein SAMN05216500_101463 [Acinetobacter sp. DSM 11652]